LTWTILKERQSRQPKGQMIENKDKLYLRELGDSLILRKASPRDVDALVDFNARIHSDEGPEKPDNRIGDWVRDLMEKPHPTTGPGDFILVEDTKNNRIVSSLNLIPQTWTYGGIPFGVGRPELVGTLPEFRNKGLVRAQFAEVHSWSAERGHLLQAITGIPYYYRLFGYDMALSLGGGRAGFKPHVLKLKDEELEPFSLRPAVEQDIPFLSKVYEYGQQRSLVSCLWTEADWLYELKGKSDQNVNRTALHIIENQESQPVGYLGHPPYTWGPMLPAVRYELIPGVSWAAVTPSVVRFLVKTGEKMLADKEGENLESFGFWLGSDHPVYQVMEESLPRVRKPYAWFIRIPDLPAFLNRVTPFLEQRLAVSSVCGHTGEIKITFYRSGIRLVFEKGRISNIELWRPEPVGHSGEAAFPDLTFTQLLLGYRSLDELKHAFADCWTNNDTTAAVLKALFPKQLSDVAGIT
jgi:hypothetical protein